MYVANTNINTLVTGANGFVGKPLYESLLSQKWNIRGAVRTHIQQQFEWEMVAVGDIDSKTDWSVALKGIDVVIHLAARVHVMKELKADPLYEFRKVNVEGTRQLALQAAKAGAKRLVYVSSIKVNGEKTTYKPFDEFDLAAPQDAYGISKCEAESALHEISKDTGLEVVIVRPPLIYGPGVKGNFLQLAKILKKRIPLPFGSINNLRSLLYVENLIDALILCATHPAAAGKTYLISDGDDISTPDLVKAMSEALGSKARLWKCPMLILNAIGKIAQKSEQVNRLVESLQVDNSKLMKELGWNPKFNLQEGLRKTFESSIL